VQGPASLVESITRITGQLDYALVIERTGGNRRANTFDQRDPDVDL
jgi:hypothetical protein